MKRNQHYKRALGIYPCQVGFAFGVVERRRGVIDWGQAELDTKNESEFIARIEAHIKRCSPAVLALETQVNTRRGERAVRQIGVTFAVSVRLGVATVALSPAAIRAALSLPSKATKHDVAGRLCEVFPEIAHHKPTKVIWKKDPRMNVFNAVALAATAIGGYVAS
jgi:hypothetical protein